MSVWDPEGRGEHAPDTAEDVRRASASPPTAPPCPAPSAAEPARGSRIFPWLLLVGPQVDLFFQQTLEVPLCARPVLAMKAALLKDSEALLCEDL